MGIQEKISRSAIARFACACLLWMPVILLTGGCGGDDAPVGELPPASGFTFFGLGADSPYNKQVRNRLSEALGSDAVGTRTPMDLSVNYPGFLKDHFPKLGALNHRLRDEAGARVEHHTIQLTYRYARRKNRPFTYVELLFSGYTRTPLYFRIKANKEGSDIIETFRQKYGQPRGIDWSAQGGSSLVWQEENDFLITSETTDRFGDPAYLIVIYFIDNIERLVETERLDSERREEEQKQAGKTAF